MLTSCADLYSSKAEASFSMIAWGPPSVGGDVIVLLRGPPGKLDMPCELDVTIGKNLLAVEGAKPGSSMAAAPISASFASATGAAKLPSRSTVADPSLLDRYSRTSEAHLLSFFS